MRGRDIILRLYILLAILVSGTGASPVGLLMLLPVFLVSKGASQMIGPLPTIATWRKFFPLGVFASFTATVATMPLMALSLIFPEHSSYAQTELANEILFAVVVAPILEELFFRGLLLRTLEKRLSERKALVISSVLFGILHFNPGIPGHILVGFVLGRLAQLTGGLWISIALHMSYNAFVIFLGLSIPENPSAWVNIAVVITIGLLGMAGIPRLRRILAANPA